MTFPIDVGENLVTVRTDNGSVTQEEIISTMSHFIDRASHYRNKQLLILDPGSGYNPSIDEVRQFAGLLRQVLGEIFTHVALVVSRELHYGLGRMTEVITGFGKQGFRVFRTKEDALTWLNQVREIDEASGPWHAPANRA
jgi:hypothetical protein